MPSVEQFFGGTNSLLLTCGQHPAEVLRAAHWLLSNPNCLVVGHRAVDDQGRRVRPEHPSAVAWDLEGAVARASNPWGILCPMFIQLLDQLIVDVFGQDQTAATFSDHNDHEHVLFLLDIACEEARRWGR
jgi:hypothetical protein